VDLAACGSRFVVTASRDQTVKFWDLTTGFCDATVSDHTDWVRCIAVRGACEAPRGGGDSSSPPDAAGDATSRLALVASSGNDRTIRVVDAHGKRDAVCELRGHDHVVEALSFLCSSALPAAGAAGRSSPSRDRLASASRDRTVRLWSVSSGGSCLATFGGHENWVRGVVLHPSGDFVVSCGDDRTVRVFDVKGGRCLRTIEDAHPHFVTCLAMHWTMPVLVTGGVDNVVRCWQLD